jgi:hypothetical protein
VFLYAPVLYEHQSGIPLPAESFLRGAAENAGHGPLKFSKETIKKLSPMTGPATCAKWNCRLGAPHGLDWHAWRSFRVNCEA